MATNPPQAETLPFWLQRFKEQRRNAIFEDYRRAKAEALAQPTALFVHEVTAPLWAVAQQRLLALEAESIIHETPRVYTDYLEEGGEEP